MRHIPIPEGREKQGEESLHHLVFHCKGCLESWKRIWAWGPLATLCIRLPPHLTHRKGPPYPPCSYDLPSLRYLFFFFDPQVTCPIQLPFRLLSMDHVPPEHSPFSSHSLSLTPSLSFPLGGVPGPLFVQRSRWSSRYIMYYWQSCSSCTHTHTHSSTPAAFRPTANSLSLLAEVSRMREREKRLCMCMCVWVCECDLYPWVAGFLIRGQGPHCSDKDRDGDRGLLEPLPEETLSYETDNVCS